MMQLFGDTIEEYLSLINDWEDSLPSPMIEEHEGIRVVRDDLLGGGSKIRFADYLVQSQPEIEEWV